MRRTFESREELIKLLTKIPWAEGKCGSEAEGKWGTVVIYEPCIDKKHFKNPIDLTIYLDRYHWSIKGFLYIHGPLNSYLGFEDEPWCEHFDVAHRPYDTRTDETKRQIEERKSKKC
jgi:hypothetical protein